MTHPMTTTTVRDQRKTIFTCTVCDRCIEIGADGALTIINRGDQSVAHAGGVFNIDVDLMEQRDAHGHPVVH